MWFVKMFEVGICILFGGFVLYVCMIDVVWFVVGVKLVVDFGLLVIVLFLLLVGCFFMM